MTMRLIQAGQDRASAGVANQSAIDGLARSGYADDGTDFQGYSRGLTGAGSPKGVISAPKGMLYHDTTATDGRGWWVKMYGTSSRGWTRVKDDVHVSAFDPNIDGVTDDATALANADAAAFATGVPLYLAPGTYRIKTNITFLSRVIAKKGVFFLRDGDITVTFAGGLEAGEYTVLKRVARGRGNYLHALTAARNTIYLRWWEIVGDGVAADDDAYQQFLDDVPEWCEVIVPSFLQIRLTNSVRLSGKAGVFLHAPPAHTDPGQGVQFVWDGPEGASLHLIDRCAWFTWQGLGVLSNKRLFDSTTASCGTAIDMDMAVLAATLGSDIVTSDVDWTFTPNTVGKRFEAQALGAGFSQYSGKVASVVPGTNGRSAHITDAAGVPLSAPGTFSTLTFSIGCGANTATGIGTNSKVRSCAMWAGTNPNWVGIFNARTSVDNEEYHVYEDIAFNGNGQLMKDYGYPLARPEVTASMSVGSNVVTLSQANDAGGTPVLDAVTSPGKQFRVARAGPNGTAPDNGFGQLLGYIGTVTDSRHFTVVSAPGGVTPVNASQSVAGKNFLIGACTGVAIENGPSFNAKGIKIVRCIFGFLACGWSNTGGSVLGWENSYTGNEEDIFIGGNQSESCSDLRANSEQSRQHIVNGTLFPFEMSGRLSCEKIAPSKGFIELTGTRNMHFPSLDIGQIPPFALAGSTAFDVHAAGGSGLVIHNVLSGGIDSDQRGLKFFGAGCFIEVKSWKDNNSGESTDWRVYGAPNAGNPRTHFGGAVFIGGCDPSIIPTSEWGDAEYTPWFDDSSNGHLLKFRGKHPNDHAIYDHAAGFLGVQFPADGAQIQFDPNTGNRFHVSVAAAGHNVNVVSTPCFVGHEFIVEITNATAGALGLTWNGTWHFTNGAWVDPGPGLRHFVKFACRDLFNFHEVCRSTVAY